MSQLLESSLRRIAPDLPDFAPGKSVPEKLVEGNRQAGDIIRKYVPNFAFDTDEAEQAIREIDLWAERNQDDLSATMQSSQQTLPEVLHLQLGAQAVQNFILAGYTTAAAGLGPWTSNKVGALVPTAPLIGDQRIDERWAADDAGYRLEVFGMIVKLERDGDMARFFQPPEAAAGLGQIPWWVIIVVLVSLAAVLVGYLYLNKRLELNNKVMRDICLEAQRQGDKETLAQCIEATKDLQVDPFKSAMSVVGKVAIAIGVGYLGFKFLLPALSSRLSSTKLKA